MASENQADVTSFQSEGGLRVFLKSVFVDLHSGADSNALVKRYSEKTNAFCENFSEGSNIYLLAKLGVLIKHTQNNDDYKEPQIQKQIRLTAKTIQAIEKQIKQKKLSESDAAKILIDVYVSFNLCLSPEILDDSSAKFITRLQDRLKQSEAQLTKNSIPRRLGSALLFISSLIVLGLVLCIAMPIVLGTAPIVIGGIVLGKSMLAGLLGGLASSIVVGTVSSLGLGASLLGLWYSFSIKVNSTVRGLGKVLRHLNHHTAKLMKPIFSRKKTHATIIDESATLPNQRAVIIHPTANSLIKMVVPGAAAVAVSSSQGTAHVMQPTQQQLKDYFEYGRLCAVFDIRLETVLKEMLTSEEIAQAYRKSQLKHRRDRIIDAKLEIEISKDIPEGIDFSISKRIFGVDSEPLLVAFAKTWITYRSTSLSSTKENLLSLIAKPHFTKAQFSIPSVSSKITEGYRSEYDRLIEGSVEDIPATLFSVLIGMLDWENYNDVTRNCNRWAGKNLVSDPRAILSKEVDEFFTEHMKAIYKFLVETKRYMSISALDKKYSENRLSVLEQKTFDAIKKEYIVFCQSRGLAVNPPDDITSTSTAKVTQLLGDEQHRRSPSVDSASDSGSEGTLSDEELGTSPSQPFPPMKKAGQDQTTTQQPNPSTLGRRLSLP